MSRNIIVTGAAGALGAAVVEKFKREGYHVIALVKPDANEVSEEADVTYEVDVTDEEAVADFVKEYQIQFGELDAIAMIVGGFAMGNLESTTQKELNRMFQLNFFSSFSMVSGFLSLFKKQQHGTFLFVGARPALQLKDGTGTVAYALSKNLVISLSEIVAEEVKGTDIRTHVFVPSIIDTPANREAMPDSDFSKWVNPADIAEAMHYAVNTPALRQMTFKLYGGV
ncbi:NAD(P)-dependent dehydrogenase (short-subunit alcohol dehydrogenase family) [Algoriphagus aquaeductus]|uniref:NAD(P)-dependent dehydrogenase (Short-subunit alcohol dehydrogenase family) n=1 Tax=Algoriphagus aquaeductus TaxID=475299 RepID=A0A326RR71_9BACT|nr:MULTISPECIES: SDR family NAD(P)-dependent oxidoreductase [Algoriphagus]PZV83008.1 NAD(P)-dependent dehydrogenase (short-subunit alcohol dehydrogenase family) [Algoriphagus aquaeductus]